MLGGCLRESGREFQTEGAAEENERDPMADFMSGVLRERCEEERRMRLGLLMVIRSER